MLRSLVGLLLAANLLFWAWHWPPVADALGLVRSEREPQRLSRQLHADEIRLLSPAGLAAPLPVPAPAAPIDAVAAGGTASAASAPLAVAACMEAGPMDEASLAQWRRELLQWGATPDRWLDIRRELPGSVAIYIGRLADADQVARKSQELRQLGVPHEVAPAAQAPGLFLGRFTSTEQAQQGLQRLQAKGVRTARLLTLVPPSTEHVLRVERAEPDWQTRMLSAPAAAASGAAASSSGVWRRCTG